MKNLYTAFVKRHRTKQEINCNEFDVSN